MLLIYDTLDRHDEALQMRYVHCQPPTSKLHLGIVGEIETRSRTYIYEIHLFTVRLTV